jgi:uncharacterized SAM-binding protein YcdF (DUF218 family)
VTTERLLTVEPDSASETRLAADTHLATGTKPVPGAAPPRRRLAWLRVSIWTWLARLVAAAVTVVVVTVAVTAFAVWWVARQDSHPRSDVLIVLGASQYNGRPSEVFAARLDHARDLYRDGVAPRVITVGGSRPGDAYTEAEAGANYLAARGVPRSALVVVGQGDDTLMSLRAAATVMNAHGWRGAVLVTDPWHSLRSRQMASDLHIAAHTSPERTGPVMHGRTTEIRYIGRETAAYLFYRLFHRASPPGAAPPAI